MVWKMLTFLFISISFRMDIQMPIMDGLEATRRLRIMGYTALPIYGLTASVSRSDFTELGFTDWIAKPISMKDLKTKLNKLKESQQHRRPLSTIHDESHTISP